MTEFLGEVGAWLADPATWSGGNGLLVRLWEHLWISGVSLAAAVAIGLPVGLAIGHTGKGAGAVVAVANIGRAVPSLGLLGLAFLLLLPLGLGVGPVPGIIALTLLGIPPIVVNTYVGLREVDADLVEAARGMGMRERDVLTRVEVPIATPVILAGAADVGRSDRRDGDAGGSRRRRHARPGDHRRHQHRRRGAHLRECHGRRAPRDRHRSRLCGGFSVPPRRPACAVRRAFRSRRVPCRSEGAFIVRC